MSLPTVHEVTSDWQYSYSPIVAKAEGWIAVCGPEATGDHTEPAPFPFEVYGEAPPREIIAELLEEKHKGRVSRTAHQMIELTGHNY